MYFVRSAQLSQSDKQFDSRIDNIHRAAKFFKISSISIPARPRQRTRHTDSAKMTGCSVAFTSLTPLSFSRFSLLHSKTQACPSYFNKSHVTRHPVARVRRSPIPKIDIPATLYDTEPMKDIDMNPFDFSSLRGRVVLVVNVASEDRKADENYKSFSQLLEEYHGAGLEIVVFPCNWFGQYETGSFEEIKKFVHSKYSDRIKVMAKSNIEINPVLALGRKYFPGEIIWNFHGKFLFGKKGLPVARFDYLTTHEFLESEIRRYIQSPDPAIHENAPATENLIDENDDWYLVRNKIAVGGDETEDDEVEEDEDEEDDEEEDPDVDRELEPDDNE